jgi:hypothetical protein
MGPIACKIHQFFPYVNSAVIRGQEEEGVSGGAQKTLDIFHVYDNLRATVDVLDSCPENLKREGTNGERNFPNCMDFIVDLFLAVNRLAHSPCE